MPISPSPPLVSALPAASASRAPLDDPVRRLHTPDRRPRATSRRALPAMNAPLFALPPCFASPSRALRGTRFQPARRPPPLPRPPRPAARLRLCCCAQEAAPPDPASPPVDIRDVELVAIPMTAGGDVLFPGGSQLLTLQAEEADRVLRAVAGKEKPEFAYLPVSAWGEPATVGTMAVVDDIQMHLDAGQSSLLCTGVSRFRVLHLGNDMHTARVELFWDDEPAGEDIDELERLEQQLIETMKQIVRLSIKLNEGGDEQRQIALAETLKRMQAFCGEVGEEQGKKLLQHWIFELSPKLRRELLSFIVIDLVSISFMDRRNLMMSTNTASRLTEALRCLAPFVKELAAKGAIVSALGPDVAEEDGLAPGPPLSP